MKEPIRMVTNYLDLLEMELDDMNEETKEYMYYAVDGANRLQTMLQDLLSYSRLNTHASPHTAVDFTEAVENAKRTVTAQIQNTNATVAVSSLPTIHAEQNHVETLFEHLLQNSLTYIDDDTQPEITIEATETGDEYQFTITDNGIGIAEDQQERMFEVFTRGPDAGDYIDGEGIGLAMCKRIVENHNGDIWIDETTDTGKGTTIHFTLPQQE